MERSERIACLVVAIVTSVSCGGSDPAPAPDAGPVVGPRPKVVRVSPDGNDAGDGTDGPVATLSRATDLARLHPEITDIEILAGRYEMPSTTAGSYALPATVQRLAGPPGGGATLVGSSTANQDTGLIVTAGRVENLDFEHFYTAIEAKETVALANLHITGCAIGIRATFNDVNDVFIKPKVEIENVDIAHGDLPTDQCTIGVELIIDGELTISHLTTHAVGVALRGPLDASYKPATISIASSNLGATRGCDSAVVDLGASKATLEDVILDGGLYGFDSYDAAEVTLRRCTVSHQVTGIGGSGSYQLVDTKVTGSGTGIIVNHGTWSLTNVTVTDNDVGLILQGSSANPIALTMRGSTVSGSRQDGVKVSGPVHADLGTAASLGGNVIRGNAAAGINVRADNGVPDVTASGNTWNAGVQGADADGHYIVVETLAGPIAASPGANFTLAAGASLKR